jgi:hypothetical protein
MTVVLDTCCFVATQQDTSPVIVGRDVITTNEDTFVGNTAKHGKIKDDEKSNGRDAVAGEMSTSRYSNHSSAPEGVAGPSVLSSTSMRGHSNI